MIILGIFGLLVHLQCLKKFLVYKRHLIKIFAEQEPNLSSKKTPCVISSLPSDTAFTLQAISV